jgi:hypothetical protein
MFSHSKQNFADYYRSVITFLQVNQFCIVYDVYLCNDNFHVCYNRLHFIIALNVVIQTVL